MKKTLPLLANIFAEILFGFGLYFVKRCMNVLGQDTVKYLAFRFAIGFIFMSLLVLLRIVKVNYKKKPVGILFLCGLMNPLISQVLETSAVLYTPTNQIAMLSSISPILVILLCAWINKEKIHLKPAMFVCLSVFGVFLTSASAVEGGNILGLTLVITSLIALSLGRVFVRKAGKDFTPFETTYVTTGMGALGFVTGTVVMHSLKGDLGSFFTGLAQVDFVVPVLYMGIVTCVFAFLLLNYAAAKLPAAVFAATSTLYTVVSIIAGVLLLGEPLRLIDLIGGAIIIIGMIGATVSHKVEPTAVKNKK
jgi:drug/metabolite transporter (DMT)-like permease